jgi:hypothetical protein
MTEPFARPAVGRESPWRRVGLFGLTATLLATACVAATPDTAPLPPDREAEPRPLALIDARLPADPPADKGKEPTVGGMALFAGWPKDQKPDAVLVLTGQTFGFLQPCGCSRPQVGGLERRAVFIDSLRARGWPVVGVDLGDIFPEKPAVWEQGKLKYAAAMKALREMGYVAVGVGKTELSADLYKLIAAYALQPGNERPFTLAGNVNGVADGKVIPRAQWFPPPPGGKRPLVELIEVADAGAVPVGVAGVVGASLADEAKKNKLDPFLDFGPSAAALKQATGALAQHPKRPQINVLIYQGKSEDAAAAAKDWPQFQVVLCQADTDLPPLLPQKVGNTLVVQVGHKGQHVGVLGAFKKPDGGFDFKYQLVPMGEAYITPGTEAEARRTNKVLPILDEYAKAVKETIDLAKDYPRTPHRAQIEAGLLKPAVQLSYVGSEACKRCHAAEHAKWAKSGHSHALDTLETKAKRPGLRHLDGECVRCHTVGFEHNTGYADAKLTPHLSHVGCESCHGPGSGHSANPKDKDLLRLQSPWKQQGADKLPDLAFMEKMAKTDPFERGKVAIPPAQLQLINAVSATCMKCHDQENDPHFDLYKYWPKVEHAPPKK